MCFIANFDAFAFQAGHTPTRWQHMQLVTGVQCKQCWVPSSKRCSTCCRPPPVPRLRNSGTQSQLRVAEFDEDVSNWGRQVMEDQDYEDDEMSHASLSSGLSPRESKPRSKPWDLADGYKVSSPSHLTRCLQATNTDLCLTATQAGLT